MATSMDVAGYFQATLWNDAESDLTNLKMQKLCAYAQGISLALLDRPLFDDPLEAWHHGPVIPKLYDAFEKYGNLPLPSGALSEEYARNAFDDEQKLVLELTKINYGAIAAWELRNLSHIDFPGFFGSKREIPVQKIKERFSELPFIKKLKNYKVSCGNNRVLTEREFMDALRA